MTRSKDVDPTGQFERAQAEVAGISHEAIPPKLDSIEPEAGGLWRKKPVVIEAFRFGIDKPPLWWKEAVDEGKAGVNKFKQAFIHTLEGVMMADNHDWIIRGVRGELYPCKPEIFEATYEAASTAPAPVAVPAGYRLVPEEPTEEMKVAGLKEGDILGELIDWKGPNSATRDDILRVWSAMLSASPVPSTATQAGAVTRALSDLIDQVQAWIEGVDRGTSWDYWDHHFKALKYGGLDKARAALASSPETARDRAEENAR